MILVPIYEGVNQELGYWAAAGCLQGDIKPASQDAVVERGAIVLASTNQMQFASDSYMVSATPNPSLTARELLSAWGRILTGRVPLLSIEITRECPLSCPGCYAYGESHLGGGTTLRELNDLHGDALIEGVLGLVRKYKPVHVSLVGGEPLIRHRELRRARLLPVRLCDQRRFTLDQTIKLAGPLRIDHFVKGSISLGLLANRLRRQSIRPSRWPAGAAKPKPRADLVQIQS